MQQDKNENFIFNGLEDLREYIDHVKTKYQNQEFMDQISIQDFLMEMENIYEFVYFMEKK